MNLKIYKIVVLACFTLMVTACSIDEIQPKNQLTEESVITNEASANNVLNKIYNAHRSFSISSMAGALEYYGVYKDPVQGVFGATGFDTNNVQEDVQLLRDIYTNYYAIINDANFFIEKLEAGSAVGLDDTRKNEMLAEARFFRAFAHFGLLKVFGEFYDTSSQYGVVVNLEPVRTVADKTARSTVQQTYDAIIADLQFAAANAGSGRQHFYVSATTAQALLAKVQLYMGDYASATTNALAVINNTDGYALAANYADIFAGPTARWGEEVLFAPFVDGFNEGDALTSIYFPTFIAAPSALYAAIADASDGAMDGVDDFGAPESGYDSRYYYIYSWATQGINANGKYPFSDYNTDGTQGNTYYYLRMAEVYLIYAEAEARRPGGDLDNALTRLNEVRDRANMPLKSLTDQATLLNDIREEKVMELCSETAEPYYDLVRYDQLGELDASSLKAALTDDKFTLPIPAAALAGNPLLEPNP